jgi:hypothetical protein
VKCPVGSLDSIDFEEDGSEDEFDRLGRGLSSRIAFSTTTRFVQARANSLNTPFSLAQSSILSTKHLSAFW